MIYYSQFSTSKLFLMGKHTTNEMIENKIMVLISIARPLCGVM